MKDVSSNFAIVITGVLMWLTWPFEGMWCAWLKLFPYRDQKDCDYDYPNTIVGAKSKKYIYWPLIILIIIFHDFCFNYYWTRTLKHSFQILPKKYLWFPRQYRSYVFISFWNVKINLNYNIETSCSSFFTIGPSPSLNTNANVSWNYL